MAPATYRLGGILLVLSFLVGSAGAGPQDREPPLPKVSARGGGSAGPANFDQAVEWMRGDNQARILFALRSLELADVYAPRQAQIARECERLLNGKDRLVALAAVRTLGVWAMRDQVPSLLKALDDPSPFVREGAILALATTKDRQGIAPVAKFLPDFFARDSATRALIAYGPGVEEEVRKYLNHDNAAAREAAARVLRQIGKAGKDDDYVAALAAVKGKNFFGRKKGLEWFENNDPTPAQQAEAGKVLVGLLEADNPQTRTAAASVLIKWAGRDEAPALVEALKANRKALGGNKSLIRALARLRDDRAIPVLGLLLDHFTDGKEAVKALVAFGAIAEEDVLTHLDDEGFQAKANACKVLAEIGTRRSLEPLRQAQANAQKSMYGGWRDVADSAKEAIKAIEKRR
jgi:HEAT repeat protein